MEPSDREQWLALARRDMSALEARLLFALLTVERDSPPLSPAALAVRVGVPCTVAVQRVLRALARDGYASTERVGRRALHYRPALPALALPTALVYLSTSVEPNEVQPEPTPAPEPVKGDSYLKRFDRLHWELLGCEFPFKGRAPRLLKKLVEQWGEDDVQTMFRDYHERRGALPGCSFIDFAQNAHRYAPKPSATAAPAGGWVRSVDFAPGDDD